MMYVVGSKLGSSPRMRGAQLQNVRLTRQAGIIPAYAGSTTTSHTREPHARDHPRVCGEHENAGMPFPRVRGSSPRMRGAHARPMGLKRFHGIIPAYAGSTDVMKKSDLKFWDHPRVCGEHAFEHMFQTLLMGSSPRMRGAPRR